MTGSDAKAEARSRARAGRREGPPADAEALARQALDLVESLAGPRRVTAYASYGTEPPTPALISSLEGAGFEVLLPRVVDRDLEWVLSEAPSRESAMGIAEPTGPPVDLLPVRALLIPALAVSLTGDRLGKGGGFYDRTLALLPPGETVVAAVVRDEDVVAEIPVEPHDRPVDAILTPSRVIWINRRPSL